MSVGSTTDVQYSSKSVRKPRHAVPQQSQSQQQLDKATQGTTRYPRRGKRLLAPEHATNNTEVSENQIRESDVDTIPPAETNNNQHTTKFVAECMMPTSLGAFKMRSYTYDSRSTKLEPIVMVSGDVSGSEDVLVRVHDACFTSEVFGSLRCDCRDQLQESLKVVHNEGGVVIYLQQEGRGIGIANKVAAYSLQDNGADTVDANLHLGFKDELREYMAVPDILADLNIKSIRLITNNPFKIDALTSLGVNITDRIPIHIPSNKHNSRYLLSKRDRMNHILPELVNDDFWTPEDSMLSADAVSRGIDEDGSSSSSDEYSSEDGESKGHKNTIPVGTSTAPATVPATSVFDMVPQGREPGHDITKGYAFGKESVEAAIAAIKEGKIVLVTDDEGRENEGDLIMAAEKATPETIGFIVRYSSGVICVSMEAQRLKELNLPPMVITNEDPKQTAYTVSVDYKHGTTTGISSADRAAAFRGLANPLSTAQDFQRPGHVFPLRYREGGVLSRGGHTEASLDLTRLAGLAPAGNHNQTYCNLTIDPTLDLPWPYSDTTLILA